MSSLCGFLLFLFWHTLCRKTRLVFGLSSLNSYKTGWALRGCYDDGLLEVGVVGSC